MSKAWPNRSHGHRRQASEQACDPTVVETPVRNSRYVASCTPGLRYFVNRRPVKTLRRTADVVFPRLTVAVFIDGCFWHGCPEHHTASRTNPEYWAAKVQQNRTRDAETDERLKAAGWTVIRLWEHVPVSVAADIVEHTVRAPSIRAPSTPDTAG